MKDVIQAEEAGRYKAIAVVVPCLFIIVFLFCFFMIALKVQALFEEAISGFEEYSIHQAMIDQITSGTVIDKKIINGHRASGVGLVTPPGLSQPCVVIGANQGYIPTQYRLYISGVYVIDGETYEAEKHFDVPAEIYQEYSIGDFFDSQNF